MKLIDLLVRELKYWPDDVHCMTQDSDGDLNWHNDNSTPELNDEGVTWKCDESWMDYHRGWEISDDWEKAIVTRDQYESALAASQKVEWDGVGVPPVGCECELSNAVEFYTHSGSTDFDEGTPVVVGGTVNFGLGDFVAVKVKGTNCITDINPCFLRPIRSEADKKRDAAGEAIYRAINWNHEGDVERNSRFEDYCKAYDAILAGKIPGIPGVKLED